MEKKKKWYQTGEFEDGYQFGDIFRTIKNAVNKETSKTSKDKTKISQEKEKIIKNSDSEIFASIYAPDNMGRLPDTDTIAQRMGYKNALDLKEYKATHPELFDAMGGIKYDTTENSILARNNIQLSNLQTNAKNRIVERFNNTNTAELQDIIKTLNTKEIKNANTIKKYSDTVNRYVNDYIALEELGYFNSVPESERTKHVQALKSVKEFVNSKTGQKGGYFQKGALENGEVGTAFRATSKDIKTDVGAGFLGIGEKFLDWVASVAEADTETRMRQAQNDAIIHNAVWGGDKTEEEIVADYENMIQENKKQTTAFIAGDLYNEHEIAKKIVVGSYAPSTAIKNGDFSVEGFKDAYKKEVDYIENDMESDSVLAEKSDALAETTGHYLGQVVLSKVGVPWYLTAYTTAAGGETENALKRGAAYEEAVLSGTWSGGGEVASELMFGGPLSKTGLDDLIAKKVGSIFTKSYLKGLGKFGIKVLGEGIEEPVSSGIARFGQWLTYQDDKTLKEMLWSPEARQEYVDSFIGGVLLGGMGQGYKAINTKVQGVDYVTGLTKSESKVVDEVYKNAIFEVVKSGKELTQKEKVEIYDNTLKKVKSGQVDTQTIEAALGGEDYSAYKNATGNYDVLQQELNEIQAIDNKVKTKEQAAKEQELKQRLEQAKIRADKLKSILQKKIAEKIDIDNINLKDRESYLGDSYIRSLQNAVNDNVDNAKMPQKFDDEAFVEGLWDDGRNTVNNEKTEYVENSQLESVENVGKNIYNKNILNSLDDPMQEITGIAEKSNPHEIEAFKKEIENNGVILKRSDVERIGYAPGLKKGEPGVLYISDNASFSAWCHEMQHMRDDKALGWCGMSIIADPNIRFEWEMKAYGIEIELAKKLGRNDIVKRLTDNLEKERKKIYGE